MALQGTIKDFGLPDIFQLIGIQRKTGVLTLQSSSDEVAVHFLDGRVVSAETKAQSMEDLLGSVLVRTGRITQSQLKNALSKQKRTLQRLGYVLVQTGSISEADLVEALRVQSLQIVYRLFRWRDGSYHFHPTDQVEYDERHFTPIDAETILMEGARMVDEWPIIERKVRSESMVLRRTEAAEQFDLQVESIVESDLDFDFDFGGSGSGGESDASEQGDEREFRLSSDEREILGLIDGSRTVLDITDRSSLGEFDTSRVLADLMTRTLVEEIRRVTPEDAKGRSRRGPSRLVQWMLTGMVAAGALAAVVTLPTNPLTPWRLAENDPAGARLRHYASQARVERIEKAIQVFYLDSGAFPLELGLLAKNGYLADSDLEDPWGRPYEYRLSTGGYQVLGLDGRGEPSELLSISHSFGAVQRMMADRSLPAEESSSDPAP